MKRLFIFLALGSLQFVQKQSLAVYDWTAPLEEKLRDALEEERARARQGELRL